MLSPRFSAFAGLARSPFTSTLPPPISSVASERVLKNRAAQSHLSSRTPSLSSFFVIVVLTLAAFTPPPNALARHDRPLHPPLHSSARSGGGFADAPPLARHRWGRERSASVGRAAGA